MHKNDYRRGELQAARMRNPEYARRYTHAHSFKGKTKERAIQHFCDWQRAGRPSDFPEFSADAKPEIGEWLERAGLAKTEA
jgi:hypothetical protein